MREFKSLNPLGLPGSFDVKVQGERPIVRVEESKGRITISYTFPGFYLSDGRHSVKGERLAFKRVSVADTGLLQEGGRPLLPSFGRYVQIPYDCDFEVTVEKGKPLEFDDVLVLPADTRPPAKPERQHVFEYDKELYSSDRFYPSELVEIAGPYVINGYNALMVHVRPLQHNPAKKKLIGFGNISVSINVSTRKARPGGYHSVRPELRDEGYGNLFLNPRTGIDKRLGIGRTKKVERARTRGLPPLGPDDQPEFDWLLPEFKRLVPEFDRPHTVELPAWMLAEQSEFLIIYDARFKDAAEKLAEWKGTRGMTTATVSIATVGNEPAKMKSYIRNVKRFISPNLNYVLLLGDAGAIMPENTYPEESLCTDYYYSTDRDPDPEDIDLVFPWLSIGRIPVESADQAMAVVDRVIAYEKTPPTNSEYYSKITLAARFEDTGSSYPVPDGQEYGRRVFIAEEIRRCLVDDHGFEVERVYTSEIPASEIEEYKGGIPVPDEVREAIVDADTATAMLVNATSEGRLVICYMGHGSTAGWADPLFEMEHLEGIAPETPTIFYSSGCSTGVFDLENLGYSPDISFAEKLLRMENGAPAEVAASRNSWPWIGWSLTLGLFDAMWGGVIPTFPLSGQGYPLRHNRIGDVLNCAKAYVPLCWLIHEELEELMFSVKEAFERFHVIGDPTLELWRAAPVEIDMDVAVLTDNSLRVTLSDYPEGTVITVWHDGKMLMKKTPRYNLPIWIPLDSFELPQGVEVSVCFWAPGHRFQDVSVTVG